MDATLNKRSLAYGIPGLILQVAGFAGGLILEEVDPHLAPVIGLSVTWLGIGLLVVGMCYYARAKGQSWAWGFVGLLSIIGLIILAALPDRHGDRTTLRSMSLDSSTPVTDEGPVFHCIACGYILNTITSSNCPECGRQFNPHDPVTMRVADAQGRDWLTKENIPWTARWSLICGILNLILVCVPPFNLIAIVCGISFGHSARRAVRGKPSMKSTARIAMAGLILNYFALFATFVLIAIFIVAIVNQ